MGTAMLTKEILAVLREYCGPKVVTKLISAQKKSQTIEQRILGKHRPSIVRRRAGELSLTEGVSLAHLLTICKENLDDYDYQEVLLHIGNIFKTHGKLDKAEQTYNLVVEPRRPLDQEEYVAEALLRRGEVYSIQGRWNRASTDLGRSREIYRKANNKSSLAKIENILAANLAEQGKIHEAEESFLKALRHFEDTEQEWMSGTVLMNLGIIQNIIGNYDEALNYYRRVLPYFQGLGDVNRLAELRHNMGMSYLMKGNHSEAQHEFDKSLVYSQKLQTSVLIGSSLVGKALASYHQKDYSLALAFCNQSLDEFAKTNDDLRAAEGFKVKGMIFREKNQFSLAEPIFQTSLRLNEEHNNRLGCAETYYEIGILEEKRHQTKPALFAYKEALENFKKVGASAEANRCVVAMRRLTTTTTSKSKKRE